MQLNTIYEYILPINKKNLLELRFELRALSPADGYLPKDFITFQECHQLETKPLIHEPWGDSKIQNITIRKRKTS